MYIGHARLCACLSSLHAYIYCIEQDVTWGMVGVPPSCALLGRFAIGARVSLLWQHSANAKCQPVLVLALCLGLNVTSTVNCHLIQFSSFVAMWMVPYGHHTVRHFLTFILLFSVYGCIMRINMTTYVREVKVWRHVVASRHETKQCIYKRRCWCA